MRTIGNAVRYAGFLLLAAFALLSCSKEYVLDSDNLDMTVSIGGDAFALPIGTTDSLTLSSMLELEEGGMISIDENGYYVLSVEQDFNQQFDLSDFIQDLSIEGMKAEFNDKTLRIPDLSMIDIGDGYPIDLMELFREQDAMEFELFYDFEMAKESGLVRLDSILLEGGTILPELKFSASSYQDNIPEGMTVKMELAVPARFVFEGQSPADGYDENIISFEGTTDENGYVNLQPQQIRRLDFNVSESEPYTFTDSFRVESLTLDVTQEYLDAISMSQYSVDLSVNVGDPEISPSDFYGLVDVDIDEIYESFTLDGIPSFLKDENTILDFYAPQLSATIATNSTIPITISTELTPYTEGNPDTQSAVELTLTTPYTEDPENAVSETYVWGSEDIGSLLRRIPDMIEINMLPFTDTVAVKQHRITTSVSSYSVDGAFSFTLPFSFGEDLSLTASTTFEGLPDILGQAIANAQINLKGEVISTFPVSLALSVRFLDDNKEPLDIEVSDVTIASCVNEGEMAVTPLNLSIEKNPLAENISSLELQFSLLAGSTPGIPVGENDYVQASLYVEIPGGLTLDLSELGDNAE